MIRGAVIPKHEHEKFLALSNPSDILDLSRTHPVFWGLAAKTRLITHDNAPVKGALKSRCSGTFGDVHLPSDLAKSNPPMRTQFYFVPKLLLKALFSPIRQSGTNRSRSFTSSVDQSALTPSNFI